MKSFSKYFKPALLLFLTGFFSLTSKNTKELIVNGDFSGGNVGFQSDYQYSPGNMVQPRAYAITKNAKLEYKKFDSCKGHTTGDDFYMLVNGSVTAGKNVWEETLYNLDKYQAYYFSFWMMSIDTINPAIINIYINGKELKNSPHWAYPTPCQWNEFYNFWNSEEADTAQIVIYDSNLKFYGNDFGLDDISFLSECIVSCNAGETKFICKGESAVLGDTAYGNMPPLSYDWSPKTGLSAFNVLHPIASPDSSMEYILTVTDSLGCMSFDTTHVYVIQKPDSVISTSKITNIICPCDSIILTAPDGTEYLWNDNEKTKSITVHNAGLYSVKTTNDYGCSSYSRIEIKNFVISTAITLDNINAKIGDTVFLPAHVDFNLDNFKCGPYNPTVSFSYNPSLLVLNNSWNKNLIIDKNNKTATIRNLPIDSLKYLIFTATLGNDSCSVLKLEDFQTDCPELNANLINGNFCITDLCKANGNRLFETHGQTYLFQNRPNPAGTYTEINFSIGDEGNYELYIMNTLGQKVLTISNGSNKSGQYKFDISTEFLKNGIYYIVLKTATEYRVERMEVIK